MFSEIFRSWLRVLFRPSAATFQQEAMDVSFDRTLVGISMAGMLAGIGYFIHEAIIFFGRALSGLPGTVWETTPLGLMRSAFVSFVILPPVYVIAFFLAARMSLAFARLVRPASAADFTLHAYLLSLAVAPPTVLASLLVAVPVAGVPLAIIALLYQFYVAAQAVRTAHQTGFVAALLVWLLPFALAVALTAAVYFGLAGLVNSMAARR